MRQTPEEIAALCYYSRTEDHCRDNSTVHTSCRVEGTEIHLCSVHWNNWSRLVHDDERLKNHCPRCVNAYLVRLESQAYSPAVTIADEPITGPLAEAIDRALLASGILAPTRTEILRRLAADTDAYVAAVMSRQAGAMA